MSASILCLEGVRVRREGRLVTVPDLRVEPGEAVAITGANGVGKTTLLLAAAGLVDLAAGRVQAFGRPFHEGAAPGAADLRRRMALAAQVPLLLAGSVRGNLAWGLRFRGMARRDVRARVDRWLDRMAIAHLASRSAPHLSGGEQRLVALARAFALQPEVLFLDEPFVHLDRAAVPMMEALVAETAATGTTVLVALHDRGQAARLATRTVLLDATP